MIRVAVFGAGTIGKRVAEAVRLQSDMRLIGIAVAGPSRTSLAAAHAGHRLFAERRDAEGFRACGLEPSGAPDDLARAVDVVVDCLPSRLGIPRVAGRLAKAPAVIVQGGEAHAETGFTFNSLVNFEAARGRRAARIGSCNTTGLARVFVALRRAVAIDHVHAALTRSCSDSGKADRGMVNGAMVTLGSSHHGADLQVLFPDMEIATQAISAPMTNGHLVSLFVRLAGAASEADVLASLAATPRVALRSGAGPQPWPPGDETLRRASRRGDRAEVFVWRDSVRVHGRTLLAQVAIPMEAIVIPENIDCIRALAAAPTTACASLRQTDLALGLQSEGKTYEAAA